MSDKKEVPTNSILSPINVSNTLEKVASAASKLKKKFISCLELTGNSMLVVYNIFKSDQDLLSGDAKKTQVLFFSDKDKDKDKNKGATNSEQHDLDVLKNVKSGIFNLLADQANQADFQDKYHDIKAALFKFMEMFQTYFRENIKPNFHKVGLKIEKFSNIQNDSLNNVMNHEEKFKIYLCQFELIASIEDQGVSLNPARGKLLPKGTIIGYLVYPFGLELVSELSLFRSFDRSRLLVNEQLNLGIHFLEFINFLAIEKDLVIPLNIRATGFKPADLIEYLSHLKNSKRLQRISLELPQGIPYIDDSGKEATQEERNLMAQLIAKINDSSAKGDIAFSVGANRLKTPITPYNTISPSPPTARTPRRTTGSDNNTT